MLCLCLPAISRAQDPASITAPIVLRYTGVLPPTSGAVTITFSLYSSQFSGAPLWSETQNIVPENTGQYAALLGLTTDLPFDLFATKQVRWIGVQIAGQEEQPRVILASVPYAAKALDTDALGGVPARSYVTEARLAEWVSALGSAPLRSAEQFAADPSSAQVAPSGAVIIDRTGRPLRPVGTANAAPGPRFSLFLNGSNQAVAEAFNDATNLSLPLLLNPQGGNVGIRTVNPLDALHVTGNIRISGQGNGLMFADGSAMTTAATGTLTQLTAGSGLTGGGTSGNVTLAVNATVARTNSANAFTGDQTVSGAVTATSFSGSGSSLTNVNAALLNGNSASAFAPATASTVYVAKTGDVMTGTLTAPALSTAALTLNGESVANAPRMIAAAFIPNLTSGVVAARIIPDKAITITRVTASLQDWNQTCTAARIRVSDGSQGSDLLTSSNETESGAENLTFAAGANVRVSVAGAPTCTTGSAANANVLVQYRMQGSGEAFGCATGSTQCSGICEATASDLSNCGTCGNVCNGTNGSASCTSGQCGISCFTGYNDCDHSLTNGCETNTNTSVSNCGACGTVCSTNNITNAACSGGTCGGTCNAGFADCNNNKQADGCETNTNSSVSNCGACGAVCSTNNIANVACSGGTCSGACNSGFADCNNNKLVDGCETNTNTSVSNCGACGVTCSTNNVATSICSSGVCNGTCNAGFLNCDGNIGSSGCNCAGTACCGSSCQPAHSNGVGQNFYDCSPLGTYTLTTANEAAAAYPPAGTTAQATCGSGGTAANVVFKQGTNYCVVWSYSNSTAGHVLLNSANNSCTCPAFTDPMWN